MSSIEEKLLQISGEKEYKTGLQKIITEYLRMKLHLLKLENLRFENKWEMSFHEFEQRTPQLINGMTFEIEQEYYDWESVITDIEYYSKELASWK